MLNMNAVTKTFGNFKALDGLSMHVPKGAVYGLVGPNGAGKSTAIRLLTGVYRQDSGTITLQGEPIFENPAAKARMCYIPDEIFYFPSASLEEMRKYYKGFYPKFDDELFNRLYDVFELPKKSPIRRFSKGMQKQAAFHLSICTRPDVLILDEPVDGLDPVMRRQVMSLILSDVAQRETTVLISSHNLRELEDVCDHVGVIDHGKMLLERALSQLQEDFVKVQIVFPPESTQILPQVTPLHHSSTGRVHTFILKCGAQAAEQAARACQPVFYDILPLTLEEIFIYELGGAEYAVKELVF